MQPTLRMTKHALSNLTAASVPMLPMRHSNRAKCIVLVPYTHQIVPECDNALRELERRGYVVQRVPGFAAIDQARNQLATDALRDGFSETMWIDSDVGFHPDDVDRLRSHELPIVCGIYTQKGRRALASHQLPGTEKLVFGRKGGLTEILFAATGFLHVRRQVYEDVQRENALPDCNTRFGKNTVPYFMPMVFDDGKGPWYLAEDYAFSHRVRNCGIKIMADTRIRLRHFGLYGYSWEDAGGDFKRFDNYSYHFVSPPVVEPSATVDFQPVSPNQAAQV